MVSQVSPTVDQTTHIDATTVCNVALGGPSSIAQSIKAVTDGAMVVDFATYSGAFATATVGGSQTQIGSAATGSVNHNVASYQIQATAGPITNTENLNNGSTLNAVLDTRGIHFRTVLSEQKVSKVATTCGSIL